jgi:hypothetical protein
MSGTCQGATCSMSNATANYLCSLKCGSAICEECFRSCACDSEFCDTCVRQKTEPKGVRICSKCAKGTYVWSDAPVLPVIAPAIPAHGSSDGVSGHLPPRVHDTNPPSVKFDIIRWDKNLEIIQQPKVLREWTTLFDDLGLQIFAALLLVDAVGLVHQMHGGYKQHNPRQARLIACVPLRCRNTHAYNVSTLSAQDQKIIGDKYYLPSSSVDANSIGLAHTHRLCLLSFSPPHTETKTQQNILCYSLCLVTFENVDRTVM